VPLQGTPGKPGSLSVMAFRHEPDCPAVSKDAYRGVGRGGQ
jgi:hypothetical protein